MEGTPLATPRRGGRRHVLLRPKRTLSSQKQRVPACSPFSRRCETRPLPFVAVNVGDIHITTHLKQILQMQRIRWISGPSGANNLAQTRVRAGARMIFFLK